MDLLDDDDLLNLRRRARSTDPEAVVAEERSARTEMPSQNRDLSEWASRQPETGTQEPVSKDAACHVCKTRAGRSKCANCGRMACQADTWVMLRLCRLCAREHRFKGDLDE